MNTHYRNWSSQGRFTKMICRPSKELGVCDNDKDKARYSCMVLCSKSNIGAVARAWLVFRMITFTNQNIYIARAVSHTAYSKVLHLHNSAAWSPTRSVLFSLVAYGSGKRMVTGTRAGSRIKTENFKRRLLPHHMSQRRDIWFTNSPAISCFNPRFVDRSVQYEAKQRRVNFRRCFGNIPLAAGNVSVTNIGSSRTEPKAPVTDYRNRGSGNHTAPMRHKYTFGRP